MELIPTRCAAAMGDRFDLFEDPDPPVSLELLRRGLVKPLLRHDDEIVWGFALIRSALSAGIEALPVVDTEDEGESLIALALELEGRRDRYTIQERVALLEITEELCGEASGRIRTLVQSSGSFVESATRFRNLPKACGALVVSGRLELRTAEGIAGLPEAVLRLIGERAGLTSSSLRMVGLWLEEIRRRDSLTEAECIKLVERVLDSSDPVATARAVRFPALAGLSLRFEAVRRSALEGSGIRLEGPVDFEGDSYTLGFTFRSRVELESRLARAASLLDECDELFDLL